MEYRADKYYDYEEMKELLTGWAEEYKDIMKLSSFGKTLMGREMYVAEVTIGGKAQEKPGILIDGGIHSLELIGSAVAIYALHYFLTGSKSDPEVEKILTEKTLYFIPRINCDGMEEDIYGRGWYRGSLNRFHEEEDGITTEDIDGNGEILKMRIRAEDGEWKCWEKDPRLLVKRTPADTEGPFYHVFDEGFLRGPKTDPLKQARCACDLDPNRQWPFDWDRHAIGITMRECAGPYPMYDVELRNLADFVVAHNNIAVDVNEHSYMGAYISPMEFFKEKNIPVDDSMIFEQIGKAAHEETGYMYDHIFPIGLQGPAHGSFSPWLYFDRGIAAWCNENWTIEQMYRTVDAAHPITAMDALKDPADVLQEKEDMMQWADENGEYVFEPWHEFDHPQLGKVEIGGIRELWVMWNPPVRFLEAQCKMALLFINRCISSAPQMQILKAEKCLPKNQNSLPKTGQKLIEEEKSLSGSKNCCKVTVTVTNTGIFPSFGTRKALEEKLTTHGQICVKKEDQVLASKELPEIYGGMTIPISFELDGDYAEDDLTVEIHTERAGNLRMICQ